MLYYDTLLKKNIDEEIKKITDCKDIINIKFDARKKDMLFLIGILFASNSKINVVNVEDLELSTDRRSFDKMIYKWHLEKSSANISYSPKLNNIFLICPVRRADLKQLEKINKYLNETEKQGLKVYYPARDTNQIDDIGYRICRDNASAIANSDRVHIFYDQDSSGSIFDLGVAYYYQWLDKNRKFKIINIEELEFKENDFGDYIVLNMQNS
jgi:hypothetical protein